MPLPFRRGPSRRPTSRPRLWAELLEGREAPSTLTDPGAPPPPGPAPAANQAPAAAAANQDANKPPVISDFRAVVGPDGQVTFTGRVTDDQPVAGTMVTIGGGGGVAVWAIVQSDGTFKVTTTVTSPSDVTVTARATDSAGATSDPVQTTFTPSA